MRDINDLGINSINYVRVIDIYWLDADLASGELDFISSNLFADPVTQDYCYDRSPGFGDEDAPDHHSIEVAYNAGVTDPLEATVFKALDDLGVIGVRAIRTSHRYLLNGLLDNQQLEDIGNRLLVNPIIQHVVSGEPVGFLPSPGYRFSLKEVDLAREGRQFGFSVDELAAITRYFRSLGRNPTDIELETLAQTWSEHCVHKTFKSRIRMGGETIDNLIQDTIMKVTRELGKPWCLSVFSDNAGVIDFDGKQALCFKVETHNHPSAIEPYGGAATGIGGVVRDPLGTGKGARPIMNTDVFCFAPPDYPYQRLPRGVLHPRRTFKGVRAGVADYGNRLGIPTLNGAVLFDERYLANPLVFCGTVGIMPRDYARSGEQKPGDLVVVVGGRTGRDGIHGVTFASEQLTGESSSTSLSAVQIGNPIVEKKVIDVLLEARDRNLYNRITDCGGGGLSSAVGEMGGDTGVKVDLDRVPLKYSGLSYSEIWISESQERMLLAVPPDCIAEIKELFASEGVEAAVVGEFTDDRMLRLFYDGNLVCDLGMEFLHGGIPQVEREAEWERVVYTEPNFCCPEDLGPALMEILGSWNVCSKEWVIRQYDHEVQGASVLKPLVGRENDGPGDATVIQPLPDSTMGAIVSCGINPRYGEIDPYWMAASAIDEALRQIIAVGGNLSRVALLDNFCWGDVQQPDILGALVRAARACYDLALVFETPFISGKDSLYNEFEDKGKIISIPHTLLISAVGVMEDTRRAVSMDFKNAGNIIYIVGSTWEEMGGSAYLMTRDLTGNSVPMVRPHQAKWLMERLAKATAGGLVRSCHDCSEGGIGVALAEMAFAGGTGALVHLRSVALGERMDRDDYVLFSESNSRFLVEIRPEDEERFIDIMGEGVQFAAIGQVTGNGMLEVYGLKGNRILYEKVGLLKEVWQKPLRW